jgi:predicted lactoylglutathione lyase
MTKMISLYLPVKDVEASTQFYMALGCGTIRRADIDETATIVWSETIIFQLMTHARFASVTPMAIADVKKYRAMVIVLTVDSREEVDAVLETAASYGGKADWRPPDDTDEAYSRAFEDPDGHLFEAASIDVKRAAMARIAAGPSSVRS